MLCSLCVKTYKLDFQISLLAKNKYRIIYREFLTFKVIDMLLPPQKNTLYLSKAKHTISRQNNENKVLSNTIDCGENVSSKKIYGIRQKTVPMNLAVNACIK